jgi:imidazolonepropionase-like amidohydrolase
VIALAARLYGISPAVALGAATVDAARALGLDDRGTLERGELAGPQVVA